MGTAVLEFEEYGSWRESNQYELIARVNVNDREIMRASYSNNSMSAIKQLAFEVASRLEARGYQDAEVLIDPLNRASGLPSLLRIEGFEHLIKDELDKHHKGDIKIKAIEACTDTR